MDDELRAVGDRLLAAAREARAYGLAAAHIGEIEPVVVIGAAEGQAHELLFNPRIIAVAHQTEKGEEGSVSLPGVRVQIERPQWVEIAYTSARGAPQTARLEGFLARVALHEIEQMQGIFFLEKVSRLKRDQALRKAQKLAG